MKLHQGFLLLVLLVLWSACQPELEPVEVAGELEFSKDTVFLDTLFTRHSSTTQILKVYNRSQRDVFIPEIRLAGGESSSYRLNVDGLAGTTFQDIEILARDSIFIFIETTVDLQQSEQQQFLYEDAIEFLSSDHLQKIPLVTLVKEAVFLYPKKNEEGMIQTIPIGRDPSGTDIRVQGFYLTGESLTMTKEHNYLIYGYAVIPEEKTLVIGPGTRIYFHTNSGIIVSENASLQINGNPSEDGEALENEVIFQGDRLSETYEDTPGQWGGIWFQKGSTNNLVSNAIIRNAEIGILIEGYIGEETPSLQLRNTQIYNSAINGLRGISAQLTAENLVIDQSGQSSLHITGGNYEFRHATLVNYWGEGYRSLPAVFLENFQDLSGTTKHLPMDAYFSNCIIYGNLERELLLNALDTAPFQFLLENCLLRFEDPSGSFQELPLYEFGNSTHFRELILNKDPFFWNPQESVFRLQADSPAIDAGNLTTARQVPYDILQKSRLPQPDLGAYERFVPEEK